MLFKTSCHRVRDTKDNHAVSIVSATILSPIHTVFPWLCPCYVPDALACGCSLQTHYFRFWTRSAGNFRPSPTVPFARHPRSSMHHHTKFDRKNA